MAVELKRAHTLPMATFLEQPVTVLTCLCLNVLGPLLRRADERKEVPACGKLPLPKEWSASVKDGWVEGCLRGRWGWSGHA